MATTRRIDGNLGERRMSGSNRMEVTEGQAELQRQRQQRHHRTEPEMSPHRPHRALTRFSRSPHSAGTGRRRYGPNFARPRARCQLLLRPRPGAGRATPNPPLRGKLNESDMLAPEEELNMPPPTT